MSDRAEQDWSLLVITSNHLEASIIEGKLREQGIAVTIQKEAAGMLYGLTSGPLAEAKIFVPANQKEAAEKILSDS